MKAGFYFKLARDGIRKNKQTYLPYILTCIGMVMMNYILIFLQDSPIIAGISGGDTIQYMLSLGTGVMAVFSCIFLFYTNSFLMRRRKKEFGLYNILGMGKGHVGVLICWETGLIFVVSLACGLLGGILLSKLAELGILALMKAETSFRFTVSLYGISRTLTVFSVIFGLLLLNALRQIWFSKTITLLKSEAEGEKPPRANWFLAILGAVILGFAYTIALKLKNPVTALVWFFVAVLMVIVATYLLMISGSVVLCKLLQKSKKYYYRPKHFVSVSSMTYRMKRNGAGLASICILATMILVMVSSTFSLYAGMEDSLISRYPREINLTFHIDEEQFSKDNITTLHSNVDDLCREHDAQPQNVMSYRRANLAGVVENGIVEVDPARTDVFRPDDFSNVYQIFFVPLEDFNEVMGTDKSLEEGEALMFTNRQKIKMDHISFNRGPSYTIKENLEACFDDGEMAMTVIPSMILVVEDVPQAVAGFVDEQGETLYSYNWKLGFDTDLHRQQEQALFDDLEDSLRQHLIDEDWNFYGYYAESRNEERDGFLGLYGGLFYLGILLSIVFLFAAVLIIYYKQISEGYEDQKRFEIMQKVGMTKQEIRKSINSQLLTVFFLPLLGAGVHICFAYPIIEKLLMMFQLQNRSLFILTTLGSFLFFAVFYVIVYRITSNAYYRIVSQARK